MRQRDDRYAHEVLEAPAFDGILVSKAIVDGTGMGSSRYTPGQRRRLLFGGVRRFFRLDTASGPRLETMGDCGAFGYVKEDEPPFSVEDVITFYQDCGFDAGVSVDHIILGFDAEHDQSSFFDGVPAQWRERQELTLQLADEFLRAHKRRRCTFEPIGVAQGWSPLSYAHSVDKLQQMGYVRIALGGMVALRTPDIIRTLQGVDTTRKTTTRLHLFGVTRLDQLHVFGDHGVASIDSTSPFRQAFKDDKDNYHTLDRNYPAIRVPQSDASPGLLKKIRAGQVAQADAVRLERLCLDRLQAFEDSEATIEEVLDTLRSYEELHDGKKDRTVPYRELLVATPWRTCPCGICKSVGRQVILFRGSERNKRRGFHNLFVFYRKLQAELTASHS